MDAASGLPWAPVSQLRPQGTESQVGPGMWEVILPSDVNYL